MTMDPVNAFEPSTEYSVVVNAELADGTLVDLTSTFSTGGAADAGSDDTGN